MSAPDQASGSYEQRAACLRERLGRLSSLAVAFSGGVDSAVLLHAAQAALGARAHGVIADSPALPRRELAEAVELAARIGARLAIVRTDELSDPRYQANAGDRCYWCKRALFAAMQAYAGEHGIACLAFGEITDDLLDDRPGARAATEGGVLAPLRAAGFSKADVRRYAHEHGLCVADKPASACLASRLPRGTPVSAARLARVERGEEALRGLGLSVLRVRDHGDLARVELGERELQDAVRLAQPIERLLLDIGFSRVELAAYLAPAQRAALARPRSALEHGQ